MNFQPEEAKITNKLEKNYTVNWSLTIKGSRAYTRNNLKAIFTERYPQVFYMKLVS